MWLWSMLMPRLRAEHPGESGSLQWTNREGINPLTCLLVRWYINAISRNVKLFLSMQKKHTWPHFWWRQEPDTNSDVIGTPMQAHRADEFQSAADESSLMLTSSPWDWRQNNVQHQNESWAGQWWFCACCLSICSHSSCVEKQLLMASVTDGVMSSR